MPYIGQKPHDKVVTASEISDGIITADKLASDSVTTAKIADNGVTTAKINADAVTDAKVADDVIGTEHLTAGEVDTTALGADAVTAAKIADNAISEEHLDATVVTGLTALAAQPADTDEFLISDAGTLKKIDYSYIKGSTNLNHFGALAITSDVAISGAGVLSPGIIHNYNSSITVSSGKIKVAQTGWYLVLYGLSGKCTSGSDAFRPIITITENDGGATEDGNYAYLYLNGNNYDTGFVSYLWDVTDTTNQAVYMGYAEASNITLFGDGGGKRDVTYMQIYRLGDT